MIDIIVFIILVVFFAIFIVLVFPYSIEMLLINISIIVLVLIKGSSDIKKEKMLSFYIVSAFITSIMYIARQTFMPLFRLMKSIFIIDFVQALILIFVIANVLKIIYVYGGKFIKEYSKKKK